MRPRTGSATTRVSIVTAILLLGAASACAKESIVWREPGYAADSSPDVLAASDSAPAAAPAADACPGSARVASLGGARYAVWWSPRPDGSAALLSARSDDGGATWRPPVPVDTLDRPGLGCRRPPPAIAADARTGYVDVVYWLNAPEGPGIFFSHSMDRGALYHSPIAIVYGERPSAASVAVTGDTVAVAYEDPNAKRPMVGLALSRTSGHIFEARGITVSGGTAAARAPRVALGGRTVTVSWTDASGKMAVRVGDLR